MRLGVLDVAILRGSCGHEILKQVLRDVSNLGDRTVKRFDIHLGRFGRTADLPNVLESCSVNLFIVRGGLEIVKGVNVSAHAKHGNPLSVVPE
jgi:hypothetical protein